MATANKRTILGWAMFDVANSAYTTVVITVVYSAFFVTQIVPSDSDFANRYWAIAIGLSSIIAMVMAPLLGTLVDHFGGKKRMLLLTMWCCAIATASLGFVEPGMVWWAVALLVVSNACWMLSESLCASFLSDIADEQSMGWISGLGWGVGYLGGLASLVLVLFGVIHSGADQTANYVAEHRWAMVAVALFFVVASIPTMLWLPEPKPLKPVSVTGSMRLAWHQFSATTALVKQLPVLWHFLLIFTLYSAGMATVIKFFGIYVESELSLTAAEKTTVFLALQLSAFIGAVGFGLLERLVGPRLLVILTLLWWLLGLIAIHQLNTLSLWLSIAEGRLFVICTVVAGAGLGASQSASRTIVGLLAPLSHSAQIFGYWGLFARLAAIVGTAAFAVVADLLSTRQALLVVMAFFVVGALLMCRLQLDRGKQQAKTLNAA